MRLLTVLASAIFICGFTVSTHGIISGQTLAPPGGDTGMPTSAVAYWLGANYTSGAWVNEEGDTAYDLTVNGSPTFGSGKFTMDGTDDYFSLSSNPTDVAEMHETSGKNHWFAIMMKYQTNGAVNKGIFTTASGTSNIGLSLYFRGAETLRADQRGSASVTATSTATGTDETVICVGFSHDSTGNNSRFWIGSTTGATVAHNYSDTTTDATAVFQIGRRPGTDYMLSGTEVYAAALGIDEYADNTMMATVFAQMETDTGVDCTP
jgi:hypothetical protein